MHECICKLRNDSPAPDLFTEKSLTQFPCAMQQTYPNLTTGMLPFLCLLPFVSTYLCEQEGILMMANGTRLSWALFFHRCRRHPLRVSDWVIAWYFFRSQT